MALRLEKVSWKPERKKSLRKAFQRFRRDFRLAILLCHYPLMAVFHFLFKEPFLLRLLLLRIHPGHGFVEFAQGFLLGFVHALGYLDN